MPHVARDPVMLFRFALKENDLALAGGLLGILRGPRTRDRLERELRRAGRGRSSPSLGALRTFAHLAGALGLSGERDYDRPW